MSQETAKPRSVELLTQSGINRIPAYTKLAHARASPPQMPIFFEVFQCAGDGDGMSGIDRLDRLP